MKLHKRLWIAALLLTAGIALAWGFKPSLSAPFAARQEPGIATGIVFDDRNRNGVRDADEPGLRGVRVSNQRDIVLTDAEGRYRLPVDDDTILFVIKPRGWMTPLSKDNLPRFYYIHKPKGSPPNYRYAGVPPTGPLPASVDFPLTPQREPNKFRALLFGDPQPRDQKEIDYISHDVIEELVGFDASFGVTLGDIMFDNLSLFDSLNRSIALIGMPWYNVIGNHDINYDSPDDKHSDETFESRYGPAYYSFDYGSVHFLVLDDVNWIGKTESAAGRYTGGFGVQQMEFIRKDLSLIPKDQLVVLMMHIPLVNAGDRQELYRLIENRPFALSISGHTHYQEHRFITEKDGWKGAKPHHHLINVTVCGSWWSGAPDENGIPHTTMRDGAPNGYSILTFDGRKYSLEFRAARRPATYQMNIYAPEEITPSESAQTQILVNVFFGSEKSKVEMRLGESGDWTPMEQVAVEDPAYAAMKALEASTKPPPGRTLPAIMKSPHIWRAMLPANPMPGTYLLHVRTKDMFGKTYADRRLLRIR
jgi:hypothetical protein